VVTTKPLESCGVCHDTGKAYDAGAGHALTGVATVSDVNFEDDGGDLVISYNLKVDGQNASDFVVLSSGYRISGGFRSDPGANAPTGGMDGNYEIRIPGGVAEAGAGSRYVLRVANGPNSFCPDDPADCDDHAVVSGDYPAAGFADAVSDQSCVDCHGPGGVVIHPNYGWPALVPSQCIACHENVSDGISTPYENFFPESYTGFVGLIHGLHNSHNMPGGHYEFNEETLFSVTYPTYMNNCSVCHTETGMLAAANGMTVTKDNCFSCHGSTEGFGEALDELAFHSAYDDVVYPSEICLDCHVAGGAARDYVTVTDFHNGLTTERAGVIWNGVDTSVTEGAKFNWQITGVVDNGTTLAISWSATYDDVAVDPCNATVTATAPAFHAIPALPPVPPATSPTNRNNLSVLYTYAQGEDPILGTADSPGQAANVGVSTSNTTCAANVATTTITPARVAGATRARIALQGKPWVPAVDPADADGVMQVRAKTPTYDFVVGTGAKASDRRVIVDTTDKCLKCHVGSLYQHGGNRVDNVEMCILCHNSASNEQSVREGMGVTASEAYDGKVGQTFEMKTMLHAIHSAGAAGSPPIVIYRNRGIYAWAPEGTIIPNWPGTGRQPVFGSDDGTGAPVMQTHNYHNPTYPRLLNDCMACHDEDWESLVPDQAIAMATTLDAGDEPWTNQVDDVLQGAGAAACTSCHKSGAALGHAYQNGWEPSKFDNGRQTIIDAAP
jgi:OmcA/MtrC family decaheme c-type cytochrome